MPQDPVSDFLAQDATSLVRQKADEYGVPADFAERILNKETRKRADIISGRTRSPKGATGAMQLMPETAARLGVQDPTDYTQNIDGGVRELARLYKQYNGDQSLVAAGYNAGEGAVKKYGGKVPPYRETQDYVKEVASDPVQDFLNGSATAPAATPQKTATPRPVKTESEYPVLRAPSDVSTALFDWRSGGTQGILADSAKNAEVVKEAQRNQSPQRQRERASAVASGQNALERGASQFFNAAAKGVAGIPQGVVELSDLVGEYQPAARLGNAIQGMITGQKPQRLAPQIAPYTQQVETAIDRDVPVDTNDPNWVTAKIPRAVGGLAPFIAGGALSGGSRAVTGVLGAAGNAGDIGKEFDDAGGDPANRDKAIALAAATGLSEVLGVGKLLAKFGTNQGVMQAAKTVLEEGGQEAFQQWVNNLNAANVGAYDPNRPQLEGVGEAAVLGGLLGGGLSGVSNIAARRAQQPQIDRAPAPAAPAAPRSADTNLNPDEVLTPATGAQPIIDPVTGLPQAEVSNPATDAKVDDLFAGILGRKPNPAAEKAKVKAQEAQAYRQAAEEAAAAGDVGRQMDALQEALQRESDPQARLDLKAQLRALEPAPATRKLSGQRAPAEPALPTPPVFERAPETAALSDDVVNAPTSDLPEVDPGQQALISAGERRAQAKAEKNYALAESIAAGELAGLQARQRQIDPNDVQQVIQFASAVRALQLEIKGLQKLQAEEAKAAAPARAPRAAVPKTPKGPKVVTPKAEGVRRGQGVLKGVVPDQPDLIDNVAAMENRQGGIPPVEPVAGNVLPFEELADRAKAKVNKRANMSPVEYLKQASQGEGFRVMDSGEAEGVSAKDAKIVAFTNQGSQYGMNDAAVMLDEGGYFLPDGRRFTDPDVKEADVLDYLKQYGKQSSAGNTGGVDPRIAAEEATYYEQQVANETAPTGPTRLPSGLIAEPRRPQPIETPRSTPDYRQKALDRINAAELPDNAKQRYRDWLEQGRLTDSDVLNDPDLAPAAQSTPAEQVQEVEMRRTGTDNTPVVEMPKRATPPQPIPEELSRVYGGKITPEQAEAIQRRAKNRASVEIGLGGKFGDMARKSFMSSGGTTELPPLVSHPALREALGLPEMPAYLVEDGRVSKLWQEAAQHALDGLAEWGGVERSSRAGDDGLGRIEDAIAERINDRTLYEAFGRTVVATDTAQKRLSAVLDRPEVKTAIEAAQAEIADQRARGLKSLALRKSGKALDEALRAASEQALKDFPADAIGSYGKDWSEITKSATEEFRADIRAERLGPDGSPESWIGRRFRESIGKADGWQARESQAAQGDSEQPAASPAKSPTGRAPAPAQESAPVQTSGVDAAAARLARLRAAAQAVPQVSLEESISRSASENPPSENLPNDRLTRLQQAAQRVNGAFRLGVPATPEKAVKPEPKVSKPSGRAKAEPQVKAITVTDARNEIGAAAETDASKLRLGGPATNYREVYVQAQQSEGKPFVNKPHYGKLENVAFDYRLEDRVTPQGEKATLLLEGQSDWAQSKDRKDAPYRNSWLREVFSRTVVEARQQGQDGVLLLQTPEQVAKVQRWGRLSEKDGKYFAATIVPEVTPIIRRYVKELPELARKEAARQGVALETREVSTGDGVETLLYLPLTKGPKVEPVKTTSSGRAPAPKVGRAPVQAQTPTEIVEPRVGGYVRKDGRIYEITKYHPKEGAVWIQEPGSPGAQAIPQSEVRKITIPDDVAKAEIGEAAKEGQPSQNQPKTSGRKEKTPSQIEYRGSLLNPIEEIPKVIEGFKNLAATLSGRNPSKLYQLPADQGKLRAEIEDVVKIVKRYAKAREDAGLSIDPELAKSLSDSAQKIATAFQSGDQKGYQNARKAIDDAFVKYGVEAPSFASTRHEALKAWEKYQKAQEAAGKPLSKEYAAALIDIEQRLRFANRDGDVQAYQKAKRDLNWLTQKIEAKEDPATLGDRLLTLRAGAHFLNPKFVIRNVLSQPIVWGGDKIDNAVAATISKLAAAVRGKKSVVGFDDFSTLGSLGEGARLAMRERAEGKSIDPAYGLHPHAFSDKTALGKAGRVVEDALFFINRLPDDAFYHGYFTAKLNDLAQQYKGSKEVSLDQIIDQAHLEANKLAMRDKNWVSENLKRMQRGLNRISTFNKSEKIGLGTLVLNYAQYPGSTLKRAMEHSPLGLIDVAIEANRPGPFRERNVINALSQSLTGSAFTFGVGTLLGASGVMTGGLPDDDKEKKRLREIGYKPYQLNVSALKRWFTSGFQKQQWADGDNLVSLDWAQPWAMLLAAGAATSHAWSREMSRSDKAQETAKAMYDSIASFMDTLGDQSVAKNLTRYMETAERAVKYGESGTLAVARDIADDIVSSNVPVVLNQVRQYADPVNRSTWAEEMEDGKSVRKKGWPGFLEETILRRPQSRIPYVAENGIPGLMRGLPPIPGSRKQVTYNPQLENNNWMNAFVNPSNLSTIRPEDERDRKLLDRAPQPRKKEEKKRKPIERVKM